jgi:hypothetical protein
MKYVITLSVAVLCALLSGFAYWYLMNDITNFLGTIATIRENVSSVGQRDSIQRSQDVFLEETATERSELETFVTRDVDIVHIIETIEAAGRREKVLVTIGSVVVESPVHLKQHEVVRVTMSARGTFASLGAFTTALETFPVASRLSELKLEASTNNLWFGTYTLVLVKEKAI